MTRLHLPWSSCYWAILPAPVGGNRSSLRYRFESALPVAIDSVQCAMTAIPDGRVLAVGAPRTLVMQQLASAPGSTAWSLTPDRLPAFYSHIQPNSLVDRLELYHSACDAVPRKRVLSQCTWICSIGLLSAAVLFCAGVERRSQQADALANVLRTEAMDLAEMAAPAANAPNLPAEARLVQAQRSREQSDIPLPLCDSMLALESLWKAVPHQAGISFQEAAADQHSITCHLVLDPSANWSGVLAGLATLPGDDPAHPWRLQSDGRTVRDETKRLIHLTWSRAGAERAP